MQHVGNIRRAAYVSLQTELVNYFASYVDELCRLEMFVVTKRPFLCHHVCNAPRSE